MRAVMDAKFGARTVTTLALLIERRETVPLERSALSAAAQAFAGASATSPSAGQSAEPPWSPGVRLPISN